MTKPVQRAIPSDPVPFDELFIGIVKAVGTDLKYINKELKRLLADADYDVNRISLSSFLPLTKQLSNKPKSFDDFTERMKCGNDIRKERHRDYFALCGVEQIAKKRASLLNSDSARAKRMRFAYVIDDIVHPNEVGTLRAIYGQHFFLVSVYQDEGVRRDHLMKMLKDTTSGSNDRIKEMVDELMNRDRGAFAQKHQFSIDKTFHLGDIFIDVDDPKRQEHNERAAVSKSAGTTESNRGLSTSTLTRMFEQIFSGTRHEPSKHEVAMSYAHTAALRSGSLARRVGAAIVTPDGTLLTTGYNEVAAPGGGQYPVQRSDGEELDFRDGRYTPRDLDGFTFDQDFGYDANDIIKFQIFDDVIQKLGRTGHLQLKQGVTSWDLIDTEQSGSSGRILRSADLFDVVEYSRSVHAEMSAFMSALRHGVPVRGCYLYSTTFPCHECARHIVAAGIDRVVYLEPYPKSRVSILHQDSIVLGQRSDEEQKLDRRVVEFIPFIGISLQRQRELFSTKKRKHDFGEHHPPGRALAAKNSTAITKTARLRWATSHQYMGALICNQRREAEALAIGSLQKINEKADKSSS